MRFACFALSLSAWTIVACAPDASTGRRCLSAGDCQAGEACLDGRCAAADAGSSDGGSCSGGRVDCLGSCVDVRSDRRHCGGCDLSCDEGEACVEGSCLPPCEEGLGRCGLSCVDVTRDPAHCGGCDFGCEGGLVCERGACVEPCVPTEPPTEVCDGVDNDCDGQVDPGCEAGLVAWWRFEEAEGPVLDASGNGLVGEAMGGARRDVTGRRGNGVYFDGLAGSQVAVPDHALLSFASAFTAEAWIMPVDCSHGDSGHNTVIAKEGELLLAFQNTCHVANYANNGAWVGDFPGTLLQPGRWTHVAVTWDGATIQSWVNATAVGPGTAMAGPMTDGATTLYLGARPDCCEQTFHGRVDEVKLWNVARTGEELCASAGGAWLATSSSCRL